MLEQFWSWLVAADPTFSTAVLLLLAFGGLAILSFFFFAGPQMASRALTKEEQRVSTLGCLGLVIFPVAFTLTIVAMVV